MKVIDVHSHVLYGIDDGAQDIDESVCMIRTAYNQGVHNIFCTSHYDGNLNKYKKHISLLKHYITQENIQLMQEKIERINRGTKCMKHKITK